MKHEIKCLPQFFKASWCGDKTFEIRYNDRRYQERDEIVLKEWDPKTREFTGREIEGFITYLTTFSQKKGWCTFSYRETGRHDS